MTYSTLLDQRYQGNASQVTWCGWTLKNVQGLADFLTGEIRDRITDASGQAEFTALLRDLASTGFAQNNIAEVLTAADVENPDWAIGEALAEVHLSHTYGIVWPWNNQRDKRNLSASLPGADLLGLHGNGDNATFAFGEVKSSTEVLSPPNVMAGRSGLRQQIHNLAIDPGTAYSVLQWLMARCRGTPHDASFKGALKRYINSEKRRAVMLFGVLIRDTAPNQLDLVNHGTTLSGQVHNPTTCHLAALHLPFPISSLPTRVNGGGT